MPPTGPRKRSRIPTPKNVSPLRTATLESLVAGIEAAASSESSGSLHRVCTTLLQFVKCDTVEIVFPTGDEV